MRRASDPDALPSLLRAALAWKLCNPGISTGLSRPEWNQRVEVRAAELAKQSDERLMREIADRLALDGSIPLPLIGIWRGEESP